MSRTRAEFIHRQLKYHDDVAQVYDQRFHRRSRNHFKKISRILDRLGPLREGMSVLEVGVGTGIHAEFLLERVPGIRLRVVDLSSGMLRVSRQVLARLGGCALVQADGERLPFADGSFDAVYASGSLHHFPSPRVGVSEVIRVTRPGGRFAVMEPNALFPTNLLPALLTVEDRNILQIRQSTLRRWLEGQPVIDATVQPFMYTPPFPSQLFRLFDWIDEVLPAVPLLSSCSIMILASGVRTAVSR